MKNAHKNSRPRLPRDRWIDQDDVRQETFLRILEALRAGAIMAERGTIAQFGSGVRRMVTLETLRKLINAGRSGYRENELRGVVESPLDTLILREQAQRVGACLRCVPPNTARLIVEIAEKQVKEQATASLNPTERSRLSRARKYMRSIL